jgi:ketosteroid isomerase-like protein
MATATKLTLDSEQIIRALAQEFVKHYNDRNIDKLVALFTNDGRALSPFRPMAEEPKALRKHLEQTFKEYEPLNLKVVTAHVEFCGDIAFSVGSFEMSVRTPSGRRLDDIGKWLVAMRRVGAEWRIVAHCFNTDLPVTSLTGEHEWASHLID